MGLGLWGCQAVSIQLEDQVFERNLKGEVDHEAVVGVCLRLASTSLSKDGFRGRD